MAVLRGPHAGKEFCGGSTSREATLCRAGDQPRGGSAATISARRDSYQGGSLIAAAQRFLRLVHGEARIVGRDLEQARRPALENRRSGNSNDRSGRSGCNPCALSVATISACAASVGGAERDMVHRAGALTTGEKTFRRTHVDHRAEVVVAGPVAHDAGPRAPGVKAERAVSTSAVGSPAPTMRVTPRKPRNACSAGTSPFDQPGIWSAPFTATRASRMPSASRNGSTRSPNRFSGASWAMPRSIRRCVQ